MNYRDSDIKRFLNTLSFIPTDRVPNFELLIENKLVEYVIEKNSPVRTWDMSPEDSVELALRTGMDAVCVSAIGQLAQKRELTQDGTNMYVDGLIKTPEDLESFPLIQEMQSEETRVRQKLEMILPVVKRTSVGISVIVRSVFCNTYLAMGLENFMIGLHDSPGFIQKMMDVFLDYSLRILRTIVQFPIDFVTIDDDLADSNGIMIGKIVFGSFGYQEHRCSLKY